jgi:3-dehydroquinate synthase
VRIVVDGLAYPIVISTEAAAETARMLAACAGRVCIVADAAVRDRAETLRAHLLDKKFDVAGLFAVRAGERFKRWPSVAQLHRHFIEAAVDRDGVVVAMGGGSLTDAAGFAAATYLRGVRWLAIATTLTGMVDAAIGGKTGVNLPQGKNLIGAIWQPIGVVADVLALKTLPASAVRDGVAEMVKTAVVGDPGLLQRLQEVRVEDGPAAWAPLIAAAAQVKAGVVARDPDDRDVRAVLNLGHTFAHALERATSYRTSHGSAVALGLRGCGILARDRTGFPHEEHRAVVETLARFGLRLRLGRVRVPSVLEAMRLDKKRRRGTSRFVLPVRLGEVKTDVEVSDDEVVLTLTQLRARPGRRGW